MPWLMEWVPSGVLPPLGSKLLVVLLLSLVVVVGGWQSGHELFLSTAQTSSPRAFSSSTCVETPAPPRMATGEEGRGKEVLDEPRPLLLREATLHLPPSCIPWALCPYTDLSLSIQHLTSLLLFGLTPGPSPSLGVIPTQVWALKHKSLYRPRLYTTHDHVGDLCSFRLTGRR